MGQVAIHRPPHGLNWPWVRFEIYNKIRVGYICPNIIESNFFYSTFKNVIFVVFYAIIFFISLHITGVTTNDNVIRL